MQLSQCLIFYYRTLFLKLLIIHFSLNSLNVVLVSLPDKFLDETTASLKANFPKQKFISVAAKFDHKTDYMPAIIEVREFYKPLQPLLTNFIRHAPFITEVLILLWHISC